LVQAAGLLLAAVAVAVLAWAPSAAVLSACCVLLGVGIAPFFPATFATLMRRRPSARSAGLIIAVSGLGAALFPWLMGVLSTRSGSLRIAMVVPWGLAVLLLLLSLVFRSNGPFSTPTAGERMVKTGV
jgi:fucose permease